jgi:DNA polymerase gamma 1
VQSPDGYKIVGADFASQEMRLFALIGDSFKGRIGSSELSRLLVAGEDIHTALSVKSGAPRQICKNINYGAVYGLGLASAEVYCSLAGMQNPRSRAKEILSSLKGTKSGSVLSGGLASLPFNALARLIADPFNTVSPILGNKLTKGLGTSDFATSRQNWIVQTSGCDLRDLLVTTLHAMDSSYRILLYVHDEPRYLVPEGQVDQFVKDLQQAHLETMTYVFEALGIDDQVPEPYQYFDGVEIDSYWRKDAKDPCVTPTRPIGLSPGTEITRPTV